MDGGSHAQSLAASEIANLRLATVLATAVDGIVIIDPLGTILTVNQATERLFGYTAEEMVGRNVTMLMPEPYHSAHDGYLARYRATGERHIIGIGREVMARRKDGSTFPMELAVGEANSEAGRFFTGFIRDVSSRKETESRLREAKRTIESIIAALPVAVIVLDHADVVTIWNPAAASILGWTAADTVGRPLPSCLFVEDPALLTEGSHQTRTIHGKEVRCRRKDGTLTEVWLTNAPLHDEAGKPAGALCVMDDITQRKSLASQLHQAQKMEAVGQLTGGLAHDFNNILGIAIGNLDLLAEMVEDRGDSRDAIEATLAALLKGAALTRQLLAFSRRQPLQPERVEIEGPLGSSIGMLRRMLGEQIEVTFHVQGPVWPVAVDIAQLESAITNLAINARDAMPQQGRLIISLSNAHLDEDYAASTPDVQAGDYVLIEVTDTGHGMTPYVRSRAVEPFFSTKQPAKGTGLGLSMVYGFIKQSGGHIRIYSEVGHGTTVKLYLPRAAGEEQAETTELPADSMVGGNETILVVEDNPDVRRVVVRQLRSLGYRPLEAEDAPSALVVLGGNDTVDLVFTDVVMPHGMSGFELAREVERLRPGLPVLFTSGFPGTTFSASPNLGSDIELLSKPYRKQDLAGAIRRVLEPRSASHGKQAAGRRR